MSSSSSGDDYGLKDLDLFTLVENRAGQAVRGNAQQLTASTQDNMGQTSESLKQRFERLNINLDKQEEVIVENEIAHWKLDQLQKEYKNLFFKCKDIKQMLDRYADNNSLL